MDCLKKDMMIKLCKELFYDGQYDNYVFETVSIISYADGEIVVKGYLYLIDYEENYMSVDMFHYYDEVFGDITRIEYINMEGFIASKYYYIHQSEDFYTAKEFISKKDMLNNIE